MLTRAEAAAAEWESINGLSSGLKIAWCEFTAARTAAAFAAGKLTDMLLAEVLQLLTAKCSDKACNVVLLAFT